MIITDKFVYVHMPKTGGTFVTKVLTQIHEARGDVFRKQRDDDPPEPALRRLKRRLRPAPDIVIVMQHRQSTNLYNPHGVGSKIPRAHQHKPVLGTIRNPFDRYVSQYEFKWWQQYPERLANDLDALMATYPHFPDVSFAEFVEMTNRFFVKRMPTNLGDEHQIGRQTEQIAGYYFKDPSVIERMTADDLRPERFRAHLLDKLHLISTDNLNQGLYDFLCKMGYANDEVAFILELDKIHPRRGGRNDEQRWEKYYTPELKAWVRQRERLLFDLFPEFDL